MIQEILYKLRLEDAKKHLRKEKEFYVTDLVRCPLKMEYELKYPELVLQQIYNPSTILGDAVHKGIEQILVEAKDLKLLDGSVEIEVEGSKKVDDYVVKGRIDAIIYRDNEQRIGVEIKYARSDLGLPLQHHVMQVKIYNWLFDLNETILIYLTPDRITEYRVNERVDEYEILGLITSRQAPRWGWECSYCVFSVLCPNKRTR